MIFPETVEIIVTQEDLDKSSQTYNCLVECALKRQFPVFDFTAAGNAHFVLGWRANNLQNSKTYLMPRNLQKLVSSFDDDEKVKRINKPLHYIAHKTA